MNTPPNGERRPNPLEPQSILVFQPGRYGDMVLTTPLLHALAETYPEATLDVLASRGPSVIAEHLPFVHRVIAAPRGARGILTLVRAVTAEKHDLYVDPKDHESTTSKLLARYARARRLVVAAANAPRRPHVIPIPINSGAQHYADTMMSPLLALGIDAAQRAPVLSIPEAARQRATSLRREIGDYVVVNLSSGASGRLWPEQSWQELVTRLGRDRATVLLATGQESAVARRMAGSLRRARYVPTPEFLDAAAMVSQSGGIITPDTSLVHVASAFDIPTVALFPIGADNLARFAPRAARHAALTPSNGESIDGIGVAEVLSAVERVIRG